MQSAMDDELGGKSAMGSDLTEVTIKTRLQATYVFPDMPRSMLDNVIRLSGWEKTGRLVLVNVSGSVLTLEARIVESVSYDGEVRWGGCSPA